MTTDLERLARAAVNRRAERDPANQQPWDRLSETEQAHEVAGQAASLRELEVMTYTADEIGPILDHILSQEPKQQ